MSATTNSFVPAALFNSLGAKKKSVSATRQQSTNEPGSANEPEGRVWKLSAPEIPPVSERVELFILLLCFILALAMIIGFLLEMSHLLNTDALEHVANKMLRAGA